MTSVDRNLKNYYEQDNTNVHRGVHPLGSRGTEAYEGARAKAARFIHGERVEIIFSHVGQLSSINLVASSYIRAICKEGDEIVVSAMEHHITDRTNYFKKVE